MWIRFAEDSYLFFELGCWDFVDFFYLNDDFSRGFAAKDDIEDIGIISNSKKFLSF